MANYGKFINNLCWTKTLSDGEVREFYRDGSLKVIFPNGDVTVYHADGTTEFVNPALRGWDCAN